MLAAASILGSGGFVPTGRRETSSLLLRSESGNAVVVDAGTGIRRLVTDREELLGDQSTLDVLLTHFHIDHVCGLAYLFELREHVAIRVHGPGEALYGTPTCDILSRIFSPPIMPVGLQEIGGTVHELGLGEAEIAGIHVRTRRQDRHSNPTLAMRFGDHLAWCTDTEDDPGNVEFARGVRVLAHDAWEPPPAPGHATPDAAARIATQAGAETLVIIHIPPTANEDRMLEMAAPEHGNVILGTDGMDLLAL